MLAVAMLKSPYGHLKDTLVKERILTRTRKRQTERGQENFLSKKTDIISSRGCLFCFDYGMSVERLAESRTTNNLTFLLNYGILDEQCTVCAWKKNSCEGLHSHIVF